MLKCSQVCFLFFFFFSLCIIFVLFAKVVSIFPNKVSAAQCLERDLPPSTISSSCSKGRLYKWIWRECIGQQLKQRGAQGGVFAPASWDEEAFSLFFLKCTFLLQNSPSATDYHHQTAQHWDLWQGCFSKTDNIKSQLEKPLFNMYFFE